MQQGATSEFYFKSRKNKFMNVIVTIVNPASFFAAFAVGALRSIKDQNMMFAVLNVTIAGFSLVLLAINLITWITGKTKVPDIKINANQVTIYRGHVRKPRIVDVGRIREIRMPEYDNLIEIELEDEGILIVNLSQYDGNDSEELKNAFVRIKAD